MLAICDDRQRGHQQFDGRDVRFDGGAGIFITTAGGRFGTTVCSARASPAAHLHHWGHLQQLRHRRGGQRNLSLQGGGLNGGVKRPWARAQLDFGGGTHTLNASASLSGTGTISCSAGIVNFSGTSALTGTNLIDGGTLNFSNATPAVVGALTISSGTLGGSGLVAASGPLNWSGGTISGWVQCNGGAIGGRHRII